MKKIIYIISVFLISIFSENRDHLYSSVSLTPSDNYKFDKGIFLGGQLYLGASHDNQKGFGLVHAYVVREEESLPYIKLLPFATAKATINFEKPKNADDEEALKEAKEQQAKTHPLFDKKPSLLSKYNSYFPSFTVGDNTVYVAQSSDALLQSIPLADPAGSLTKEIKSLGFTDRSIVAAVGPTEGVFGAENSGISFILGTSDNKLYPYNIGPGTQENKAFKLDLSTNTLCAIDTAASMEKNITFHWNDTLKRLYIGLKLKRANSGNAGGCVSLLVGRFKYETTGTAPNIEQNYSGNIEPAIALQKNNFFEDNNNHIVGFSHSADSIDVFSSIYNIDSLHTSTNKNYIIINGGVDTVDLKNKIYALPIIPSSYESNGTTVTVDETIVGKIADKNNIFSLGTQASNFSLATDIASQVGAGSLPNAADIDIVSLSVVGDSVLVALKGATDETSGYFKSSALFAPNGSIERWTPWQRVMGNSDPIVTGGYDQSSHHYFYATQENEQTVLKATHWEGAAPENSPVIENTASFSPLINKLFSLDVSGVTVLTDFDSKTPSFSQGSENLSMMIAASKNKIALLETSRNGVVNTTGFLSNYVESQNGVMPARNANTQAVIISGGDLEKVGVIKCLDISRGDAATLGGNKGYLFAGGLGGAVVLADDDGNGWDTNGGGLQKGFNNLTTSMKFKKIGTISDIKKIICDDEFVYILTGKSLYKIELSAANFGTNIANPTIVHLAQASTLTGKSGATFFDMVISSKAVLLATNDGLYRNGNATDIKTMTFNSANWREIKINYQGSLLSLGPVTSLDFTSATKGYNSKGGVVYVLVNNLLYNLSYVVRCRLADTSIAEIDDMTCSLIAEPNKAVICMPLGQMRDIIGSDGMILFHQSSHNYRTEDLLRMISLNSSLSSSIKGQLIDLNIDNEKFTTVQKMIRNSASGSFIVSGTFGVRIQQ